MFQFSWKSVVAGLFGARSSTKAARRRVTASSVGAVSEALEVRVVPAAAQMVIGAVAVQNVNPGQHDVPLSQFQFTRNWTSTVEDLQWEVIGTSPGALTNVRIVADLLGSNGRRGHDGVYETVIGRDLNLKDGWADIAVDTPKGVLLSKRVPAQVVGDITANAAAGTVGLQDPIIITSNPNLMFDVTGKRNPLHTVRQPIHPTVTFTIDGPTGGPDGPTFTAGETNVNLGTIHVDTNEGLLDVRTVYLAVEGRHVDETSFVHVGEAVGGLTLRNAQSGMTFAGVLNSSFSGLDIYRFENVAMDDNAVFGVTGFMDGTLLEGDHFRVHMVTETSPTGVNIAGITGTTADYNLKAQDLDTGIPVVSTIGGEINGNFERYVLPDLHIVNQSIGSTDTEVSNAKNILLYKFQASADEVSDLLFTGATFQAEVGSLFNITNAALVADTDFDGIGDTIVDPHVNAVNDLLSFNTLVGGGYVIPAGQTITFEVRTDVAQNLASDPHLRLGLVPNSVEAEIVSNGTELDPLSIQVNTVPSKEWTFTANGTIRVEADQMPRPRQVLGGAQSEELTRFTVQADYEAADVDGIQIFVTGEGVAAFNSFNLYKLGQPLPFAVATVAQTGSDPVQPGGMTFTARMLSQQFVVGEGMEGVVIVRGVTNSDEQGAISGKTFQVTIPAMGVHARGLVSSNTLVSGPTTPIVGPTNTVVLSKIVNVANANPDSDNTNVPTGISPIGQFSFTAATNVNTLNGLNKVIPDQITFDIAMTNVAIDPNAYYFYNKSDSSNKVVATSVVPTATGVRVTFASLSASNVDTRIPSGGTAVFVLQANITNSKIGTATSGVQVTLNTDLVRWFDADTNRTSITGFELGDTIIKSTAYKS